MLARLQKRRCEEDLGSVKLQLADWEIVLVHGFTVDQSVGTVRVAGAPGISETAQTDGG